MSDIPHDRLLNSISTAASLLDISASSVRRMVEAGTLPAIKLGASVRIPTSAIEALIAGAMDTSAA